MQNYVDNIFLAHELVNLAKQQAVSSNDIIPRADLPVLTPNMFPYCQRRFGQDRLNAYVQYTKQAKRVKEDLHVRARQLNIKYRIAAGMLASASLGYGESSELNNIIYAELVKRNHLNFTLVHIQSDCHQNSAHPHPFGHGFILLGGEAFLASIRASIEKVHQNVNMIQFHDQFLHLQKNIVAAEQLVKAGPAYLRGFHEMRLAVVDEELLVFKQNFLARFPSAGRVDDVEKFIKNAVQESYDLYRCFMECGDPNIVLIDPLLNFVGSISEYMQKQSAYFRQFNYSKIVHVLMPEEIRAFALHWPETENGMQTLLSYAQEKNLPAFDRNLLDLPLNAYPYMQKTEIPSNDNPGCILGLNSQGTLQFSGLHTNYYVDAVSEIRTASEMAQAKALQTRLQAGNFYRDSEYTFFVLPKVNTPPLIDKIEQYFWRTKPL